MSARHTVMLLVAQALQAASLVAARHEAADLRMRAAAVMHAVRVERELAGQQEVAAE